MTETRQITREPDKFIGQVIKSVEKDLSRNERNFFENIKEFKSLFLQLFLITICIVLSHLSVMAQNEDCTIKGKVVNEELKPVGKAFVLLYSSDFIEIGAEADEKGSFNLKFTCGQTKKPKFIYATSPILRNVKNVLLPPFDALRKHNPIYAGKPVPLSESNITNLGNIIVQVKYTVVKLALVDKFGKPFFVSQEQWSKLWLKIKDDKGILVVDQGMSVENYEKNTEADASALRVSLPEGNWTVELLPNGKKSRLSAKESFSVSRISSPLKVNMTVVQRSGGYRKTD